MCSYRRKDKWLAFGLGWFIFLSASGIDRLYLGYMAIGVVKLLLGLSWIPLAGLYLYRRVVRVTADKFIAVYVCSKVLAIVGMTAAVVWWLVDLILIGSGHLSDSHGYGLN
jgi:TM2 domain-containing membrane protein YozV